MNRNCERNRVFKIAMALCITLTLVVMSQTAFALETAGVHPVNINSAGADELISLPGIGAAKAEAIIAHRRENGPFSSAQDLLEIKGIGPGLLEKLLDLVTVQDR